jgi:CRISPR-associated protein Cmr2
MKRDFHAAHRLPAGRCEKEIDQLLKGEGEFVDLKDWGARLQLLSQAIITPSKTYAQTSDRWNNPSGLRKAIESRDLDSYFKQQRDNLLKPLGLFVDEAPSLDALPQHSFLIHFAFRLRKPYLSKDDTEFYIIDNPVRKDKVFRLSYVAPTGWKGALRAAMVRQLVEEKDKLSDEEFAEKRFRLTILFGDEKGEEGMRITGLAEFLDQVKGDEAAKSYRQKVKNYFEVEDDKPLPHHSGRLVFFPTFFTQISLEVINPHDRGTGAGRQPIYIESVPKDAEGRFTLLYVPFDRVGHEEADPVRGIRLLQDEVAFDLTIVAEGVRAMFTEYGFGAKTSSGFGVADILREGLSVQPVEFQEKTQKLLFTEEESL